METGAAEYSTATHAPRARALTRFRGRYYLAAIIVAVAVLIGHRGGGDDLAFSVVLLQVDAAPGHGLRLKAHPAAVGRGVMWLRCRL